MQDVQALVEAAWNKRELLKDAAYRKAVENTLKAVDKGLLRVADPVMNNGVAESWQVNEWVKQAILMYFAIREMETHEVGPFEFYDKMKLKSNYKELGVRAVPHAVARYGAFLGRNVVMMPSYVNIGAYVDEG